MEQKEIFDNNNKLISREKNTYSKLKEKILNAPRFKLYYWGEDHSCLTHTIQPYQIISEQWRLSSTETTIIDRNNRSLQDVKYYTYEPTYLLRNSIKTVDSSGANIEFLTKYPFDYTDAASSKMKSRHMISIPIEQISLFNNSVVKANKVIYCDTLNMYLPKKIMTFVTDQSRTIANYSSYYEEYSCFEKYNQMGNLLEQRQKSDRVVYLWGYNGQYPVVKIAGATYSQVLSLLGTVYIQELEKSNTVSISTGEYIRDKLSSLNVLVSTYIYNPLVGVTSISEPNGLLKNYLYDLFNRLSQTTDHMGKIVEQYEYHYKR